MNHNMGFYPCCQMYQICYSLYLIVYVTSLRVNLCISKTGISSTSSSPRSLDVTCADMTLLIPGVMLSFILVWPVAWPNNASSIVWYVSSNVSWAEATSVSRLLWSRSDNSIVSVFMAIPLTVPGFLFRFCLKK